MIFFLISIICLYWNFPITIILIHYPIARTPLNPKPDQCEGHTTSRKPQNSNKRDYTVFRLSKITLQSPNSKFFIFTLIPNGPDRFYRTWPHDYLLIKLKLLLPRPRFSIFYNLRWYRHTSKKLVPSCIIIPRLLIWILLILAPDQFRTDVIRGGLWVVALFEAWVSIVRCVQTWPRIWSAQRRTSYKIFRFFFWIKIYLMNLENN